jgi:hypothetical protein
MAKHSRPRAPALRTAPRTEAPSELSAGRALGGDREPVSAARGERSKLGSPALPNESYRPGSTLTEAEKRMIDFLIEKAFEAWLQSR